MTPLRPPPPAGKSTLQSVIEELRTSTFEHTAKAVEQFSLAVDSLVASNPAISESALRVCGDELMMAEKNRQAWVACLKTAESQRECGPDRSPAGHTPSGALRGGASSWARLHKGFPGGGLDGADGD